MHVVGPPVAVAVGTVATATAGPLPLGAFARRTAGRVEHAPYTDCYETRLGFGIRFLGHGAHIDIVLFEAWIRIAEHNAGQFLGMRTL